MMDILLDIFNETDGNEAFGILLDSLLSELPSKNLCENIVHMSTVTHSFAVGLSGVFHIL